MLMEVNTPAPYQPRAELNRLARVANPSADR